jgi:hypothetical protein
VQRWCRPTLLSEIFVHRDHEPQPLDMVKHTTCPLALTTDH